MKSLFFVKVSPKAFQAECVGWEENVLKVKIRESPSKGKANEALTEFLSSHLKIPKSKITLKKGHTSRLKQIEIEGISLEELKLRC